MDFQDFFKAQKNALIQEFTSDMSMCLMATTPERLMRHADEYGWKLFNLQNSKPTSAQVVQKRSGALELWVNRTYKSWVPQQTWDCDWTDEVLYKKYGITKVEISFIESMICPMGAINE